MTFSDGRVCRAAPSRNGCKSPAIRTQVSKDQDYRQADPFEPKLLLALEADSHRPKRDRRSALMLFEAIQKEGFTGGYTVVTDFIRNRRNHAVMVGAKSAFVPLRFEFGDAFQFDWSEEWLVIGGIHRKILAAHTKLCVSRAFGVWGAMEQ